MANHFSQRRLAREEQHALRAQREQSAGKLTGMFPLLGSLSLAVSESRPDSPISANRYVRRVVLAHAPALFEFPCSYSYCQNGVYDATHEVLSALRGGQVRFEGVCNCQGGCGRELHYVATAVYATPIRAPETEP